MSDRIIVTGAAGFIGSHTVEHLLAAGHTVCGVDNFRTGRRENLLSVAGHNRFLFREIDVLDARAFGAVVAELRPSAIIHLAALVSVPESIANPELNNRLNVGATRTVAEAARAYGVKRIVYASSAAVYGDCAQVPILESTPKKPMSPYGDAKLESEHLLLQDGASTGCVVRCQRYFNVYGLRQDPLSPYSGVVSVFLKHLHENSAPIVYGDGRQTRDFIEVSDVARANVMAATRPNISSGVANICTGVATPILKLWTLLSLGHRSFGLPRHRPARTGDIRESCGQPGVAKSELGFSYRIHLQAGLARLADNYKPL